MKLIFTNEKGHEVGNRGLNNNEGLCQMVVDLNGYFLPRNKTIFAEIIINDVRRGKWELNNLDNVYSLFAMIFKEWRFVDKQWEV